MAHQHPVYDTDKHFVIDPITKKISTESPKLVLAQHSQNSERFTFEIPKEVEGHDMTTCNLVEIHYQNIEAANKTNKSIDIYTVTDLQEGSGENADVVFGSWLIDKKATKYVGGLIFAIRFACITGDEKDDYIWATLTYSTITVGESVWNHETIAKEYPDIITQFEARIQALEQGGTGTPGGTTEEQIASAVEKYLQENPIGGGVAFETDASLSLFDGVLSVNTTDQMEQDNTLPITSAGVFATVGNIEALLKTI